LDFLFLSEYGGRISTIKMVEALAGFVMFPPGIGWVTPPPQSFSAVWEDFFDMGVVTVSKRFNKSRILRFYPLSC
jgi:hypothetical protein